MTITSFRAGEDLFNGDALVVTTSGVVVRGIASNLQQASVIGIALDNVSVGGLVRVCTDSVFNSPSSYFPNTAYFLSPINSGTVVDFNTWESQSAVLSASGTYLTRIGQAVSNDGLEVELEKPVYIQK